MDSIFNGKNIIGRTSKVSIPYDGIKNIPAKIDTGADASSIWATDINISDDGSLTFVLFGEGSEYFSGKKHSTKSYSAAVIRSAHGTLQVRYRVELVVDIAGRRVRGRFTLADRSKNTYPILIGCRLLNNKFLVDVSRGKVKKEPSTPWRINDELRKDPRKFFLKYHENNQRGDLEI